VAFEIKNFVPDHKNVRYDDLHDPDPPISGYDGLAMVYYQTDLMVYLCMGINFLELYDGPMNAVVAHMISKIDDEAKLPSHLPQVVRDRRAGALAILQRIHGKVVSDHGLKLRHFYENRYQNPTTLEGSVALDWIALEDLMEDYICTPWVRIQKADSRRPDDNVVVAPARMDAFIATIGDYGLIDFYTKPARHYPRLVRGIRGGRRDRVLSRPRPNGFPIAGGAVSDLVVATPGGGGGGDGGNNRRCNSTTNRCETHTGSFCTEDPATGLCSAASG
jgi:hypothetical protein